MLTGELVYLRGLTPSQLGYHLRNILSRIGIEIEGESVTAYYMKDEDAYRISVCKGIVYPEECIPVLYIRRDFIENICNRYPELSFSCERALSPYEREVVEV